MTGTARQLQVGQTVGVEVLDWGYKITALAPEQPGQAVVEVGVDYVVVDDAAGGVKTRIPMHLIKSVSVPTPVSVPAEAPAAVPAPQAA